MVSAVGKVDQEMCAFEELSLPCEEGLVGGPERMGDLLPSVLAPQAGTGSTGGRWAGRNG